LLRPVFDGARYLIQHASNVSQNIVVPKTDDENSSGGEPLGALAIAELVTLERMLATIDFNPQT